MKKCIFFDEEGSCKNKCLPFCDHCREHSCLQEMEKALLALYDEVNTLMDVVSRKDLVDEQR